MGKTTGLGDQLLIGGVDLGGDIQSIGRVGGGPTPIDLTPINTYGHVRVGGQVSGEIDLVSYFDPAAGASHATFSALPTVDTLATYVHGYVLGNPAASMVAKQINYDGNRAQDGGFTFGVNAQSNADSLEWGIQVSAGLQTDTTGTNGTGVDFTTVSTAFGWQAFLHVTALTGTNVIITLQDSADNVTFANLTGGAFTSVTAVPGWQRLVGGAAATVRRYVRVVSSGTFTSASFFTQFVRNTTAPVF